MESCSRVLRATTKITPANTTSKCKPKQQRRQQIPQTTKSNHETTGKQQQQLNIIHVGGGGGLSSHPSQSFQRTTPDQKAKKQKDNPRARKLTPRSETPRSTFSKFAPPRPPPLPRKRYSRRHGPARVQFGCTKRMRFQKNTSRSFGRSFKQQSTHMSHMLFSSLLSHVVKALAANLQNPIIEGFLANSTSTQAPTERKDPRSLVR